ncbi:MAG: FAD-dependent oxidoreductase, partial [Actinomycetota bacterium]
EETEKAGAIIKNKVADPSEVEVVNGVSWQCPVYVKRMPPCRSECPSSEDIRGYLTYIAQAETFDCEHEESVDEAWHVLTDKNPFPAVHGRICPHPCEDGCNRQHKDSSVAINNMERYIGDHGLKRGLKFKKITDKTRDQKVAIIGAGPSGLSCAFQMARRGYPVTVFESAEKPGGMLRYGIPSYRLPEDILDAEIQNIIDLGVELKCGVKIGEDVSFEQLKSDYDVVYVAVGAQKGSNMKIEGEDSGKVLSGVDFLRRINMGETVDVGKKVMVVGGGNTAIDAARVSRRLGAEVTILYRRTRNEMPAIAHEIDDSEKEGIMLEILGAPVSIKEDGGSLAVTCIKMEL